MGYTSHLRADIGTSYVDSGRQFGTRRGQTDLAPLAGRGSNNGLKPGENGEGGIRTRDGV